MSKILEQHRETWNSKKILRAAYEQWYKKIISDVFHGSKKSLEIGSGSGNLKEYLPDIISSDIDNCVWLDMCFDAHIMPFTDASLSNIIMIDVLHHLKDPIGFLTEADRVLESGGRIIMVEPFPSLFSKIIYRLFHTEPFDYEVDVFSDNIKKDKTPWESNQAIPYLIFFKSYGKFNKKFSSQFNCLKRQKLSYLLYPLSGGFEKKSLIPEFMLPVLVRLEAFVQPLNWLLAFRCYIVLEKK